MQTISTYKLLKNYALVTKSLIQTYSFLKTLSTIIIQDLRSEYQFISYCKRFKSFYCISILGPKKKIKETRKIKKAYQILRASRNSIQKLGNTWNKGKAKVEWKGKQIWRKELPYCFPLNLTVDLSTNKNMIHPTFPKNLLDFS